MNASYLREKLNVPGCCTLLRIDKLIKRADSPDSWESRYFLCGIPPNQLLPAEFQEYVLHHWDVESLHWYKDVYFNEDKHCLRERIGTVWTVLTNIAYSLARLLRTDDDSPFCSVFSHFHLFPKKALKKLGFK